MPRKLFQSILCAIPISIWTTLWAGSADPLVEIQKVDPSIQVELKYATPDNITGKILYPASFKARLRRSAAEDLKNAQQSLQALGFSLKVWDAYRPLTAQKALYAVNSDPRFVAAPGVRSMHNRGVAVDVTLVDKQGMEVKMPTKFDAMGSAASYFYKQKDSEIARNLGTLQQAMSRNGFYACRTEWWHFFSRHWKEAPNLPNDDGAAVPEKKATALP